MKKFVGLLVIVVALGLPTAVQTLPPVERFGTHFASNAGDPLFVTWVLQWELQSLTGSGSLFDGNIFYPHRNTVLWSDNLLGFVPLYGVGYALFAQNPVAAYNLVLFTSFLCGALSVFVLALFLLRDGRAAFISSALFSFSMERAGAVGHPQLAGFAFVVLFFLFLMRFLRDRRWSDAVLAGVSIAGTWYTSGYYVVLLFVATSVFLAVWLLSVRGRLGKRLFKGLFASGAVSLLLIGPSLPFYWEAFRAGMFDRSWIPMARPALQDFLVLPPSVFYKAVAHPPLDVAGAENVLFPGGLMLLFVGVAAVASLRRVARRGAGPRASMAARAPFVWPLAASGFICALVLFGPHHRVASIPYRLMAAVTPGLSAIRELRRFWMFPMLVLAVAAGWGAQRVFGTLPKRLADFGAAAVSLLVCLELVARPPFSTIDLSPTRTAANRALSRLPAGPVGEMPVASLGPGYPFVQAARQVRSLIDSMPRIEGYSGNIPDEYFPLQTVLHSFPHPDAVNILRRYGVRYVVLRGGDVACHGLFSPQEIASLRVALEGVSGVLRVMEASPDLIVELEPLPINRAIPRLAPPQQREVGPCAHN